MGSGRFPWAWMIRRWIRRPASAPGLRWAGRVALGGAALCAAQLVVAPTPWPAAAVLCWVGAFTGLTLTMFARWKPAFAASAAGLALGVAAVACVGGVASSVAWTMTARLGALNGHLMISKYGLDFVEYADVGDTARAHPEVRAVAPFAFGPVALSRQGDAPRDNAAPPVVAVLKGIDPVASGEFPGFAAVFAGTEGAAAVLRPAAPRAAPGIGLGPELASRLGVGIGDAVVVAAPRPLDGTGTARQRPPRYATFEVTALIHTGVHDLDRRLALTHLTAAQALLFGEGRVTGVEAFIDEPGRARGILREVLAPLQPARGGPLYRGTTWMDQSRELLSVVRMTQATVQAALGLIVIVAAANLVGALLIVVRRRADHIAVLGAMGASPRAIFRLFTGVGAWVGLVGGALGVALASLADALLAAVPLAVDAEVYGLSRLEMVTTPADLLLPWLATLALCVLVAAPAARMAARIAPAHTLRG